MKAALIIVTAVLALGMTAACQFSEFSQSEKLTENVDDYRTGCELDTETLMADYKQWEANRFTRPGTPTPTPKPVSDIDLVLSAHMEALWEHGCATGRRDVVGAEQTTLKSLRDQLNVIDSRLAALEATATPTPTNTPTPTP